MKIQRYQTTIASDDYGSVFSIVTKNNHGDLVKYDDIKHLLPDDKTEVEKLNDNIFNDHLRCGDNPLRGDTTEVKPFKSLCDDCIKTECTQRQETLSRCGVTLCSLGRKTK